MRLARVRNTFMQRETKCELKKCLKESNGRSYSREVSSFNSPVAIPYLLFKGFMDDN
jgi:hypothetical protein